MCFYENIGRCLFLIEYALSMTANKGVLRDCFKEKENVGWEEFFKIDQGIVHVMQFFKNCDLIGSIFLSIRKRQREEFNISWV